jgi:hypothetical protein
MRTACCYSATEDFEVISIAPRSRHLGKSLLPAELSISIGGYMANSLSNAMAQQVPYTSVLIDRFNDAEVQYWAKDLQVETYELRHAITLVGPRLTHLRRYFGKSAHIIPLIRRRPTTVSPYGLPA